MNNRKAILMALVSGAVTGLVILGLGSLLVSYGLATVYNVPMGPTTGRRLLEPVLLGTLVGGLFAIPLAWLHRRIPEKPLARVLVVGMTPFVISLLLVFLRHPPATFSWQLVLTPLATLVLFLVYGFFADRLYTLWIQKENLT